MEHLNKLSSEFDGLCIKAEEDWYEIANGKKTNDEVHDIQMRLKKKALQISEKQLKGFVIPIKDKLSNQAIEQRELYFKNQFS